LSFDLAMEVAPYFRLDPADAESILKQVRQAVRSWPDHAKALGIARAEQEIMAAAFEA
jgi:serine/threonine-protein kinase HipA